MKNQSSPLPKITNPEREFGTIPIGTRFRIDSNGVTFEKTSDREAKIVDGDIRLIGVKSQFGLSKPVHVSGMK